MDEWINIGFKKVCFKKKRRNLIRSKIQTTLNQLPAERDLILAYFIFLVLFMLCIIQAALVTALIFIYVYIQNILQTENKEKNNIIYKRCLFLIGVLLIPGFHFVV